MRRLFTAIIAGTFLFFGLSTLGGCGQIGPLYLPESQPESQPESEPAGEPEAQIESNS